MGKVINNKDLNSYLNYDDIDGNDYLKFISGEYSQKYAKANKPPKRTKFLRNRKLIDFGQNINNNKYLPAGYSYLSPYNAADLNAEMQNGANKFIKFIPRTAVKIFQEVAKMPGVVAGTLAGGLGNLADWYNNEDNHDFMETAFNNFWVTAVNNIGDSINKELLPVYTRKAVENGDLWGQITSPEFWGTEGADGLGYVLSMLVPGAIVNKFNMGSKLFGISKLAKMAKSTEKATNAFTKVAKFLGSEYANQGANLLLAGAANTYFEAGAEGQGAGESYRNSEGYKEKVKNIPKRAEEIYNEMMQEYGDTTTSYEKDAEGNIVGGNIGNAMQVQNDFRDKAMEMAKKEVEDSVSKVMANVFKTNAVILLGPNLIMAKMLWGGARGAAVETKVLDGVLQEANRGGWKGSISEITKSFGEAVFREGFWEEGLQSATEQYFTKHGDTKDASDFMLGGDFAQAYIDMLGTSSGKKAIFLGAFYGGGMQATMDYKQRTKEIANHNLLVKSGNKTLSSLAAVFEGDNFKTIDGKPVFKKDKNGNPTSEREIDYSKVNAKLKGNFRLELLKHMYDDSVEKGDREVTAKIVNELLNYTLSAFAVHKNTGDKALNDLLDDMPAISNIAEGLGIEVKEFKADIINKVKYLRNKTDNFRDFAPNIIKLANKEATADEIEDAYNKLNLDYMADHSSKYFMEGRLAYYKEKLQDIFDEKGIKKDKYEDTDYKSRDKRVAAIQSTIEGLEKSLEHNTEVLEAYWDGKSAREQFNLSIEKKRTIEAEDEAKISGVLKEISTAATQEELDNISDMADSISADQVKKAKEERSEQIKKQDDLDAEQAMKDNKDTVAESEINNAKAEDHVNYLKDNFNVGDYYDNIGVITSIDETGVTVTTETGEEIRFSSKEIFNSREDLATNNITEGGENNHRPETNQPADINDEKKFLNSTDSKVLTTHGNTGNPITWLGKEPVIWERQPRNKSGERVGINLGKVGNEKSSLNEEQEKALQMVKDNNFTDLDFIIKHLPINITMGTTSAPLFTYRSSEIPLSSFNKYWVSTQEYLRTTIVKELRDGSNFEDITVAIKGQLGGDLQIAALKNGVVVENNLKEIYEFRDKPIKPTDFFMVGAQGKLVNIDGKTMRTKRNLSNAKGEIYLAITTANGRKFPAKVNVRKLYESEAEVLYMLYKYRISDINGKVKGTKLVQLPEVDISTIKKVFKRQLEIIGKGDDVTIKDIIDFMIWDGTTNQKSQIRFYGGKLYVGSNVFSAEELNSEEGKIKFIDTLVSEKRHQIIFKKHKSKLNSHIELADPQYFSYVVETGVLNTNIDVKDKDGMPAFPFQGNTSIYLDSASVEVDNKHSKYNADIPKSYNNNLHGTNEKLKNEFPGEFDVELELNADESAYIDPKLKNPVEYSRVSELKESGSPSGSNVKNAAVRGIVTDELARLFFESIIDFNTFIAKGKAFLLQVNEKNKTTVSISDSYYKDIFKIFDWYKELFNNKNYTIYPQTHPLHGNLGKPYAGSMDFLVKDNNTGEWLIIDLKTTTKDRSIYYNNPGESKYGIKYKNGDRIQQNAYRELIYQMTGIKVSKLLIMPITVPSSMLDNSLVEHATIDKNGEFLEVDMSKDIYELVPHMATRPEKVVKSGKVEDNIEGMEGPGFKFTTDNLERADDAEIAKHTPGEAAKSITKKEEARKPVAHSEQGNSFVWTPLDGKNMNEAIKEGRTVSIAIQLDGTFRQGMLDLNNGIMYLVDKNGYPRPVTTFAEVIKVVNALPADLKEVVKGEINGKEEFVYVPFNTAEFMKKVKLRMNKMATPIQKAEAIATMEVVATPKENIEDRIKRMESYIKGKPAMLKGYISLMKRTNVKDRTAVLKELVKYLAAKNITEEEVNRCT